MGVAVTTRKFTVDEYHTMIQSGILQEDDRMELLAGEIVEMSPISSRHAAVVDKLAQLMIYRLGENGIVRIQNPVDLGKHSEPQPDIALVKYKKNFYANSLPRPEDIFLLIEVGETSIDSDRQVKLPLYATAGIPEVWLIDLLKDVVERYLEPKGDAYQRTEKYGIGQEIIPESFSQLRLAVKDILLK